MRPGWRIDLTVEVVDLGANDSGSAFDLVSAIQKICKGEGLEITKAEITANWDLDFKQDVTDRIQNV